MTEVYYSSVNELNDSDLYNKVYNSLPAFRRCKIDQIKTEKAKKQSMAAFALLCYGLKMQGINGQMNTEDFWNNLGYSMGEHGKPYFKKCSDLFFSMSHSSDIAICAVSDINVGCDIEYVAEKDKLSLAMRFFHKNEYERLCQTDSKEFYRLWTLKESFVKMIGDGLAQNFAGFDIDTSGEKINITLVDDYLLKKMSKYIIQFDELSVADNYHIAVCSSYENINHNFGFMGRKNVQYKEIGMKDIF